MSDDPKGLEVLFLWRLAIVGGGDWKKAVKPDLESASRQRLVRAGLIEAEPRTPDGGGRKLLHFALTERGWQWLSEHLNVPIATRSPVALDILVRFLDKLQAHLNVRGLCLAEFIQPPPKAGDTGRDGIDRKIETAYLTLSGGRPNVRVRLADLRDALVGTPRQALDLTLLDMASSGKASLYRLDNPLEIEPRDREATLRTPSGEERHVVYIGGRGS